MDPKNLLNNQICESVVKSYLRSDEFNIVKFLTTSKLKDVWRLLITIDYQSKEIVLPFLVVDGVNVQQKLILLDFVKVIPNFCLKLTTELRYNNPKFVILDDLEEQGFRQCTQFTVAHFEAILDVLARLHAASFAYEDIQSRRCNRKFRIAEEFKLCDHKLKVENFIGKDNDQTIFQLLQDFINSQSTCKFRKTLSLGRKNLNNVVFKNVDNCIKCKLLEFRASHCAPPLYDVLLVIFRNSDETFRQHYLHSLIRHYRKNLENNLQQLGLNVDTVFPTNDIQLQIHNLLPVVKLELLPEDATIKEVAEILNHSLLSREDGYYIVEKRLGHTNYKFESLEVKPIGQPNGYLGNYFKLLIQISLEDEKKDINCFVKCTPKSEAARHIVRHGNCFDKEIFIYKELMPQLQQFNLTTILDCIAECYFYRFEDLMVFDDLSKKNFIVLPAQIPFELHFLKLLTKKVATYHACMLAFEENKSKILGRPYRLNEDYSRYIQEVFYIQDENDPGGFLMQAGIRSIPDVINLFPELKTKCNLEHFSNTWPKLKELFFELIKTSKRFRNVLCHGDLWTNNLMFRFCNDDPVDCRFVDLQLTRYCPPAHDLLSLLYLTTDRANRARHTKEIQQIYYEELKTNLASVNCKIEEIVTFEKFIESFNYLRPHMVVQTIMYYSFIMCTSEEIASTMVNDEVANEAFFGDRRDYLEKMCSKSAVFRNRLKESVMDLYELCEIGL